MGVLQMYNFTEYLWFFIIYAFIGWCIEVIYHVVKSGEFVNRGFLNGSICPIYGLGMVIIIYLLTPLKNNLFLLFIGSFLLTSFLEFLTGYILEKIFHNKWWDYSNLPFNIKGYICLDFSIKWGLGGVFIINIIHSPISKIVSLSDNVIGHVILLFLICCLLSDFIITIFGIMKIKKHIYILDEIAKKLRYYSDDIGENIYRRTTLALKTKENVRCKFDEQKSEINLMLKEKNVNLEDLKMKYEKAIKEKNFVHKRLEKAFPTIREKLHKFNSNNINNHKE